MDSGAPGEGTGTALLSHTQIRAGMSLMQTVFAIAMVLGVKNAVEASYVLFFARHAPTAGTLSPFVVGVPFLAVSLLALRFFWVPRNLTSYLLNFQDSLEHDTLFGRLTMIHFPLALLHALVFYYVCGAFVDLAGLRAGLDSQAAANRGSYFVALYAALLFLNALWLLRITPRSAPKPGRFWAYNNLIFAALVTMLLATFRIVAFANVAFLEVASGLFILNSLIDLRKAARYYILTEDPERSTAVG